MSRLLAVALGLAAYLPLLRLGAGSLERRVESWLFIPSETSTLSVLVISLWLVYRRRERLRALPDACSPLPALLLLSVGTGIYAWARYTMAGDLLVPSLMANALGTAAWLKGRAGLRAVLAPVAFLVFALPIPPPLLNETGFRLQLLTADLAGRLLHAIGQPALIAGDQIIRTDQHFQVIEGCSGLRSMETLTMLAVLLVDLFRRTGLHAALVLLAAPPVAFAFNGLRVVALVLIPNSELLAIHTVQGIAILLGGLLTLYFWDELLGGRLRRPRRPVPGAAAERAGGPVPASAPAAALAICGALGLWFPAWSAPFTTGPTGGMEIPRQIGEWHSTDLRVDRTFLGGAGGAGAHIIRRQYRSKGQTVDLFVSVGDRGARATSPFSPATSLPGSGWVVEEERELQLGEDGPRVRARVVSSGTQRMLLYHWYEGTDGLAAETLRSALALDSSPLRSPDPGIVVRIGTPAPRGDDGEDRKARERLVRFFADLRIELEALRSRLAGKTFS